MVQLTEVVDEHFQEGQIGPEDDEDYSDTDSEISNESDYDPSDETLGERLYALRDIIPPQTRNSIYNGVNNTTGAVKSVLSFSGKTLWMLTGGNGAQPGGQGSLTAEQVGAALGKAEAKPAL
ncbi:uncharacterized protein JN550_005639 [Neoarthrinium moseri]|uniref:uncharacterized protein n=1 Tax=Neoarthrinium moseri TaxID=1658444 RepID=UPI001FDB9737|nr:uncharacterized protein JN550_005639 [Neoarthrinium moseri]KAI1869658.1 hypothetical protein JN550_005639 [Neoarthrinium moseri]